MVKKEENKIENIKLLENLLSNNDAKKALKELSLSLEESFKRGV